MDNQIFSAIFMALLMFGAGMFILDPMLRKKSASAYSDDYAETPMHHLLSRKDSIYTAMKDLEFDYKTGKLSDDDYNGLRAKFLAEAAGVLEQIDTLTGKGGERRAASKAAGNKCEDCGFVYEKGDRFCPSCGAKVTV